MKNDFGVSSNRFWAPDEEYDALHRMDEDEWKKVYLSINLVAVRKHAL